MSLDNAAAWFHHDDSWSEMPPRTDVAQEDFQEVDDLIRGLKSRRQTESDTAVPNANLGLRIHRDQATNLIVAAYLRIRPGKSAETREFDGGNVFADYDDNGALLGIEMLGPCKVEVLVDKVAKWESEDVREYLRRELPVEMAKGA